MIVCVAANPSIDKLFEVDRLVPGAIHRPVGFVQWAGGKGLNVARAARVARRRGARGGAAARARGGVDREMLSAEGVPGAFVWAHGENRASLSVADRETGGLTEFYEHGEEIPRPPGRSSPRRSRRSSPSAAWLTISRIAAARGGRGRVPGRRGRGARAGVPVALDAEGARLRRALGGGPDVVKVNADEAARAARRADGATDEALAAAQKLRERAGGDGHAGIVTLGAEGVVVVGARRRAVRGHLYERGRYPVGSGDAFLAGLVVDPSGAPAARTRSGSRSGPPRRTRSFPVRGGSTALAPSRSPNRRPSAWHERGGPQDPRRRMAGAP